MGAHQSAQESIGKRLSDELLSLTLSNRTSWEPLVDVLIAQKINAVLGGPIVGPWDVPDLDDVSIDILLGLVESLPSMRKGMTTIEEIKNRIRRSHPSFGQRATRIH